MFPAHLNRVGCAARMAITTTKEIEPSYIIKLPTELLIEFQYLTKVLLLPLLLPYKHAFCAYSYIEKEIKETHT